jgi:hypothetical protein
MRGRAEERMASETTEVEQVGEGERKEGRKEGRKEATAVSYHLRTVELE